MDKESEELGQEKNSLSRREFVRVVRGGMVILALPQAGGTSPSPFEARAETLSPQDQKPPNYRLKFFTKEEAAMVEAISARIFPSDKTPGAREARVVHFIDHMLATEYKAQQSNYRDGLGRFDKVVRAQFKRPFTELEASEQDALLARMERQEIPDWKDAGAFFSMIHMHTIEGMFSDPKYHGNAGGIGWTLIGARAHDRM